MDQVTPRHIDISEGPRISYILSGPESAPCIMLIHGWTGSTREFDSIVPGLNSAGWRTLAIDMPGHGGSGNLENLDLYSMAALASINHSVAKQLGTAPVIVLGFSMGGAIAEEFTIRHPDDTTALVLLGTAGFDWVDEEAQTEIDEAEPIVFDQGMEAHYDVWKQRNDKDEYDGFDEVELTKRRRSWAEISPHAYVGTLYGLRDKRNTVPDLVKLSKPTLIIHGDGDEDSIKEVSKRTSTLIPLSTYHVVPNASHFAHDENTPDFMSTLLEFLAPFQDR